jgi:hypothetical protein
MITVLVRADDLPAGRSIVLTRDFIYTQTEIARMSDVDDWLSISKNSLAGVEKQIVSKIHFLTICIGWGCCY